MINGDDKVLVVASRKMAEQLIKDDKDIEKQLIICPFAKSDNAIVVVKEDEWFKLLDNGEMYELPEDKP